ncbi:hypothetical protein F2P81_006009 [Scophthalmus maximus]|uniref:Uncharacterized protein n=1 Tax=Scophthalmus maximus TaxID=52904 RepID=A0A6A4T831_SCOMX|nr:hypothetical protein F2P81_006009 [Scophthalmus maximus]
MNKLDDQTVSFLNDIHSFGKEKPPKTLQLPPSPEYVVYTDSELEQARKHYFEMAHTSREGECAMSKELICRLPTEDPTIYLSAPVLVFDGSRCIIAIGTTPITTFGKEDLSEDEQNSVGEKASGDVGSHRPRVPDPFIAARSV